jgi:hypothetical protein
LQEGDSSDYDIGTKWMMTGRATGYSKVETRQERPQTGLIRGRFSGPVAIIYLSDTKFQSFSVLQNVLGWCSSRIHGAMRLMTVGGDRTLQTALYVFPVVWLVLLIVSTIRFNLA